jgi:hypothetical protein
MPRCSPPGASCRQQARASARAHLLRPLVLDGGRRAGAADGNDLQACRQAGAGEGVHVAALPAPSAERCGGGLGPAAAVARAGLCCARQAGGRQAGPLPVLIASWQTALPTKPLPPNTTSFGAAGAACGRMPPVQRLLQPPPSCRAGCCAAPFKQGVLRLQRVPACAVAAGSAGGRGVPSTASWYGPSGWEGSQRQLLCLAPRRAGAGRAPTCAWLPGSGDAVLLLTEVQTLRALELWWNRGGRGGGSAQGACHSTSQPTRNASALAARGARPPWQLETARRGAWAGGIGAPHLQAEGPAAA